MNKTLIDKLRLKAKLNGETLDCEDCVYIDNCSKSNQLDLYFQGLFLQCLCRLLLSLVILIFA